MKLETKIKCGLEVHQQLDVGKLFCNCASKLCDEKKPEFVFERKIRATASELGEHDSAALEAMKKNYFYEYEAFHESSCLVELDEEPISQINSEALNTILEICLLTNSRIVDEFKVMRKTVVDGSNVSGFQRTCLIGLGGSIQSKNKNIGIQTIILEEDAARAMKKDAENKKINYRIDRLGIPLIELATKPDIESPEQAQEIAQKIGELFRITCKAKRGLGSIRQDLNLSIQGGARIEIKGVQELEKIGLYLEREIQRQQALLEIKKELENRGLNAKEVKGQKMIELKGFENPKPFLKNKRIFGTKLPKFSRLIGKELQPNRRLGTELADYVRVKTGLKGIIHSDEKIENYGISEKETEETKKILEIGEQDAFVIIATTIVTRKEIYGDDERTAIRSGPIIAVEKETAEQAFEIIKERAAYCLKGIPEETRNALEDGNSEYSRPLPGAARMYPETDHPPITIEKNRLLEMKTKLPLWSAQRKVLYEKEFGLSSKQAEEMKLSNHARFFEELAMKGHNPVTTATLLLETLTQLKREGIETENISNQMMEELLNEIKKEKILKENIPEILSIWAKKPFIGIEEIVEETRLEKASEKEIEKIVKKIVEANKQLILEKKEKAISALMGDAMKQLRGKAKGETISKLLKKETEKIIKQQAH